MEAMTATVACSVAKCMIPGGAGPQCSDRATCRLPAGSNVSSSASSSVGIHCSRSRNLAAQRPSLSASQHLTSSAQFRSEKVVVGVRRSSGKQSRVDAVLEQTRPGESDNKVVFPPTPIWLSDVVGRQQKPYFLNRAWTKKDISYATYMVAVHCLCLLAPFTFSWDAFGCFGIMYIITGMFGITLSFHRQLSHKSFKTPKWLEYLFAYCGVLSVQGDPLEWVSAHRYHHQHCDTPQDPHTPHEGFWHSHMGWLLDDKATTARVGAQANVADMEKQPFYTWIRDTYTYHVVAMAIALYALGGLPFLVWGLAVRVVWVYHITWAVNSAAHVWGFQSWNTGDLSRNNWWVALLAFGEGWHNNHHAFEYSARHGLEWWQVDVTWLTVRALEVLGLATKVRYPTKEHMAKLTLQTE